MARPREFDSDTAISDAMNVFWAHGYDGASVAMLLKGMGLTKGSLYKAFGDKKSLFLTAMTLYEQEQVAPAVTLLTDARVADGYTRIAQVFQSIPQAVRAGDRRGCLLCSTAAIPSGEDADIARVVSLLLGQMKDAFKAALDCAKPDPVNDVLAGLLVTQYVGLRVLSRAQTPAEDLEAGAASLQYLLDRHRETGTL